jgi:dipeptidyl aminopeptidase/acylaminoacyl peptidase
MDAEFGEAQWEFDYSTYAFVDRHRIASRYRRGVTDRIAVIDTDRGVVTDLDLPVASVKPYVRTAGHRIALIGSSPTSAPRVMTYGLTDGELAVLTGPTESVDKSWLSVPEEIAVRTTDGAVAHTLYYPPTNPEADAPLGERPPLIVQPHPGPTSAAGPRLDLRVQYFTSRGFAVVAVNYRGSTGYGRAYRESLARRWGVADTEDCVAVARHLAATKRIDPRRIVISGASAGGFTALNAAAATRMFAAAVSTFGITDLESHRVSSPRFQAYKLDQLIGPYPAAREEYRRRSPLHHAHRIRCPVLLMHGLSDSVVNPSHSQSMARALRDAGVPYAHYEFEAEGHGFDKPEDIQRALELELSFYAMSLELRASDHMPTVAIQNRRALKQEHSVGL